MTNRIASLVVGSPEPKGFLAVASPYSGELLAEVAQASALDVEHALSTAYTLYRDRSVWLSVPERIGILERVADLMVAEQEALAALAAGEGGKPLMDSAVEVARAIAGVKLCIEHINSHAGEVIPVSEPAPNHRMAFTQKEPIGVVAAVSAFNHPLNLIVHQVGAAVAAGCPVLVKPAGDTPLSCIRFVELLRKAGLPEAWCQVIIPERIEDATAMITDKRVGFFSFIGSAKVGWMLRAKLAAGTRCALEHGGVAPVIVDSSADIHKVIPALLKGGFYHAGQVCVSVQRVFVHRSLSPALVAALKEGAEALRVGDPLAEDTEVGPLIRSEEVSRVASWVDSAVASGAKLITGGEVLQHNCYCPTVLLNPSPDTEVSQKEVFGPVVCVYEFDDVEQAISQANSLDVAFQAAVFSQDIDRAVGIYRKLDAAAVMVNDHTAFRVDGMPFAGLKQSGLGVGGIGHTINDMQIDKLMVLKSFH